MTATHVEQTIEDPQGRHQTVLVHIGESPLAWLHARGHLSERHYVAGDRLRADWEKAGLGARVTMRWDAAPRGRTSSLDDLFTDAQRRIGDGSCASPRIDAGDDDAKLFETGDEATLRFTLSPAYPLDAPATATRGASLVNPRRSRAVGTA